MPAIIQAGAVVIRGRGAAAEVLLVSARKDPRQWIFPKGHVEPGESAAEAALREMREEGGVDGKLIKLIGVSMYESGRVRVKVSYFLVRYRRAVLTTETRKRRWRSFDKARELVSFDDARDLVDKAERFLRRRS